MQKDIPKYRWAPSLGWGFDGTPETAWGIEKWEGDPDDTVVFCGLYGLPDFYSLWQHKGKKYVWWCGSDVTHFINGYWLEEGGGIRLDPTPLAEWINKNCENWCENEVEKRALEEVGIHAQVCPSFLGDVNKYDITFTPSTRPQVYVSSSEGWEDMYGWNIIEKIADRCDVDFHLYGSNSWKSAQSNVIVHGRVPKEQMNEEIKQMQCGLRLNVDMDGFSEITAKSVLWGQYPIVAESYGYIGLLGFSNIDDLVRKLNSLKYKTKPNPAREYYQVTLNNYPWNQLK